MEWFGPNETSNANCTRNWIYYVLQAILLDGIAIQRCMETIPAGSGAQPLNDPIPSQSTGAPSHHDPHKHKRKGQGSSRRSRRSRVDLALCIDLLRLTFTNLTLCWITTYSYRDKDC